MADSAAFDALAEDRARSDALVAELWGHLGLGGEWTRPERGSALVAVGEHEVLKLMAPHDRAFAATEVACLQHLELPVPTPELVDHGEHHGWPWIRMRRLRGRELADVWPELDRRQQDSVAEQVGHALRALHATEPPPDLHRLDWSAWLETRLPRLEHKHADAPAELVDGLEAWVRSCDLAGRDPVWLHTEVMREHLLVDEHGRLSGLFDFEPSWVGPRDYEYGSVGLFVTAGDAALFGRLQRAAGVDLDPRRLLAMALLHRYGGLAWYHRRLGGPLELDALAERWFGGAVG